MNPPDRLRRPPEYLRSVLRDGALPFEYRGGVRALLGMPDVARTGAAPAVEGPIHFAYATPTPVLEWQTPAPTLDPADELHVTWPDAALPDGDVDLPPDLTEQGPPPEGIATAGPPPQSVTRDVSTLIADHAEALSDPANYPSPPLHIGLTPRSRDLEQDPSPHATETGIRPETTAPSTDIGLRGPVGESPTGEESPPRPAMPTRSSTDVEPVKLHVPGVSERPVRLPAPAPLEPAPGRPEVVGDEERGLRRPGTPLPRPIPLAPRLSEVAPAPLPPIPHAADEPRQNRASHRRVTDSPDAVSAAEGDDPKGEPASSAHRWSEPGRQPPSAPPRRDAAPHASPTTTVEEELGLPADAAALLARLRSAAQTLAAREAPAPERPAEWEATPPPPESVATPATMPAAHQPTRRAPLPPAYWERRLGHLRARVLR